MLNFVILCLSFRYPIHPYLYESCELNMSCTAVCSTEHTAKNTIIYSRHSDRVLVAQHVVGTRLFSGGSLFSAHCGSLLHRNICSYGWRVLQCRSILSR